MVNFPEPSSEALAHSQQLREFIFDEIESKGERITFTRFMELALYAPGLGYYSAGAKKFGSAGDFVTAPEISALFSQCLAKQCQQVLEVLNGGDILELGAGSGRMALDLLLELERQKCLPEQYLILEVSADLRERQQDLLKTKIPHLYNKIAWLDCLPSAPFKGVILANEVLDALPVQRFQINKSNNIQEFYIARQDNDFAWCLGEPSTPELSQAISNLDINKNNLDENIAYDSEINLLLPAWINSLNSCLEQGLLLFIDYGFPQHEFYHADRVMGTLMCHYRHLAHPDPLVLVGLQDITAHVDFTAVAEAAADAGLHVAGYTTQAAYLLSCGLLDLATLPEDGNVRDRVILNQEIQKLTSPAEMGELFKVIALTRGLDDMNLLGFVLQDQRGRL